jgi:octaprenyl-diphosphate synthase
MTSPTPLLDRWSSFPKDRGLPALTREIRTDLARVEDRLESWSRSANPLTAEVSRYVLRKKGKRLRPALVLLTSRLFTPGSEESVFLASLVELIHTASLIHDDIVDNAEVRRGKESVHAKWGPNITVLLGDYLYIKSIGLSLQSRHDRVIRLLADVSARLIEGELDEYALSGDSRVTEEQYLNIVENKTAVLFAACCRIGAILGLASPEEEEAVASFGLNLGTTFQIVDDLLDFIGDPSVLGKPVLTDIAEGRVTLPLIHALRTGDRARRGRVEALIGRKDPSPGERKRLAADLSACGAFEYAGLKARDYAERSLEFLNRLPESTARETLIRLTVFILTRNR